MGGCVYVTATGPASGKSAIVLGITQVLARRVERVGFFRPIVGSLPDNDTELVRTRFDLPAERVGAAFTTADLRSLDGGAPTVGNGGLEHALEAYKRIEAACDIVVVEGTDFTGASAPVEFELNATLARELGGPVIAVVNGHDIDADDILDRVLVSEEDLQRRGLAVAAMIVNRAAPGVLDRLDGAAAHRSPDAPPVFTVPEIEALRRPSIRELGHALDAIVVRGEPSDLDRGAGHVKVAAMTVPNLLEHVEPGTVLITPGDRADLIVAAATTRLSPTHPSVAGLILTGGLAPDRRVIELTEQLGSDRSRLPLLVVGTDTFDTAIAASRVEGAITPSATPKIERALDLFERSVDGPRLAERIQVARTGVVTPLMFQYELIESARAARTHLVFPEGTDARVLQAAERLVRRRVCDITLLGPAAVITRMISELALDHLERHLADGGGHDPLVAERLRGAPSVDLIDPADSPLHERFAARYQALRSHKGTTHDQAFDIMADVSFFGSMMVHEGLADGMVSGATHTTAHTVRPALEFIKTRPGISIVSSVFFMLLADRVLVYGDCAVVPDPDAEQLADIAIASADTAAQFGIEPRIAMLSYSTGTSGTGADVEKVRTATRLVRAARPDLPVEGPIQYDAAIDATVGRAKLPDSDVAGRATVFVFPDLNTGNNTYKAVQRSADAMAVGPVLQGLNQPVNDLSRGTTVDDIVNVAAITAIQARGGIDQTTDGAG